MHGGSTGGERRQGALARGWRLALIAGAVLGLAAPSWAGGFRHFVTARGDQLFDGDQPLRFLSFNIPNLHLVEDELPFGQSNAWRWPDRFEIADALESVRQAGGTVTRCYVLSVVRTNDPPGTPRHVLGPGRFNEEAFRALDLVMQVANEKGVRVIIPFVDNWSWWGGIAEYAGFRGRPKEEFWTDPQVMADFEATIRFLLNRRNTLTGVRYADDKAVLCWETGNELQSPPAWTRTIAAYVKRLDRQHLVMDGYHTTELRPESLAMPEIDIVTTHHYPGGRLSFPELVRANAALARGRKPYVVGEFGFVDTPDMVATMQAIQETGAAGGLVWSLRYRRREGGFYWHSEPAGGDKYKAYHWPGFASGAGYDEAGLLAQMQQRAFAIRGLPVPALTSPTAPRLLPTHDAAAISWQGVACATSYQVERAARRSGPWTVAGAAVDEAAVQYRPLFADEGAGRGRWYYRVRSANAAGVSKPSNVVGPVNVTHRTLVDELVDGNRQSAQTGRLEFVAKGSARAAREDASRMAGEAGSAVTYELSGPVRGGRIYGFFPKSAGTFRLSVSREGAGFAPLAAQQESPEDAVGDYGYWRPVVVRAGRPETEARFFRIEFPGPAQLGRIEIDYGD